MRSFLLRSLMFYFVNNFVNFLELAELVDGAQKGIALGARVGDAISRLSRFLGLLACERA